MDNRMTAVLCCLKQQFSDGILFFCPAGAPRVRTVFQRKAVVGQQQKSAAVLLFWRTVRAKTLGKSVLIKKRTFDQIRGALLIKFGI
jgi:hypothetical protein